MQGHGTAADGTAANYDFHPIAGAVNNGQLNDKGMKPTDSTLYNWFGGIYDGGNYYIKNVNITSHCYNVGLFRYHRRRGDQNIVLYSDNDAVIQRKTDATPPPVPPAENLRHLLRPGRSGRHCLRL